MRILVPATTCFLLVLVLTGWGVALLRAPLNVDAGFYLPVARDMVRGHTLYHDLPCDYPPAVFEALSLLRPRWLATPAVVKLVWLFVHAANAVLLFCVLRRWQYHRDVAWFAATVFAAWTMALDGTAIVLEPLVNFFLLLAMLSVARGSRRTTGFIAGLLFGTALMVKQYALLSLPGMLLLLVFPRSEHAASGPSSVDIKRSPSGEAVSRVRRTPAIQFASVVFFLVAVPVPVVSYSLATGQSIAEFVSHLATFGDRVGRYEANGWRALFVSLTEGGAASTLSVYLAMATMLLIAGRRGFRAALVCGLLVTCGAIYVRDYPHYVQLPALWAVLVAVEFAVVLTRALAIDVSRSAVVLLLLSLPLLPRGLASVGVAFQTWRDDGARRQAAIAKEIAAVLPERSDVWIVNAPWLYILADLEAPLRDYRFVDSSFFDEQPEGDEKMQWLQTVPRYVVIAPGDVPTDRALACLAEAGFRPLATINAERENFTVFERSPQSRTPEAKD